MTVLNIPVEGVAALLGSAKALWKVIFYLRKRQNNQHSSWLNISFKFYVSLYAIDESVFTDKPLLGEALVPKVLQVVWVFFGIRLSKLDHNIFWNRLEYWPYI